MDKKKVIDLTIAHIQEHFSDESTGHDVFHILRVRDNALRLAKSEGVEDTFVIELAALLHDISDWKFNGGDISKGADVAREWLESLHVDADVIEHVCDIVANVTFKGFGTKTDQKTLEGKIVQDADRLDQIGAIAIARAFAYGGKTGRILHDPSRKPELHETFEEFKKSKSTSVNLFHERLFLLKDRLNTESAKKIAEDRDTFMHTYLEQFMAEWNGER